MNQGTKVIEDTTHLITSVVLPVIIVGAVLVVLVPFVLKLLFRLMKPAKKQGGIKNKVKPLTLPTPPPLPVRSEPVSYPYGMRDDFLTPAELSFHQVLRSTLSNDATIAMKVRLSDLLFTRQPDQNQSATNRIHMKHVDFVICETLTMKPRLVIELDDASHERSDRRERDAFVNEAFKAAGLPMLHVKAARGYNPPQLLAEIQQAIMSA